ncbi:MAG: uracil-DNA glycosylase [Opitutales bacterium]
MRQRLEAIIDELKRLKMEGVDRVLLADHTFACLEAVAEAHGAGLGEGGARAVKRAEVAAAAEPGDGSGTAASFSRTLNQAQPKAAPRKARPGTASGEGDTSALPPPPEIHLPDQPVAEQWTWLRKRVLECAVCSSQVKPGKQVVFGVGNREADVFLCGEAPGAEEEVQGEPFVGPAGQLLDKILAAAGMPRETVYIGNIMNWRPDAGKSWGNRPPTREELAFCLPYLKAQVHLVRPKLIIALGGTAIRGLLGPDREWKVGQVHGHWHQFEGIPVMPTYHPSYLLHNDTRAAKRKVWEDFLKVMEKLEMPISDKQRSYFL